MLQRSRRHWQKRFLPTLLFCLFAAGAGCCYWRPEYFLRHFTQESTVSAAYAIMLMLLLGCGSPVQLALVPCLCLASGALTAVSFLQSGLPDLSAARESIQWALAFLPAFLGSALTCMRAALIVWIGRQGSREDPAPYFWFSLLITAGGLTLLILVERFFM